MFCGGKKCSLFANTDHRVIQWLGDEENRALTWCVITCEKIVSNMIADNRHQT